MKIKFTCIHCADECTLPCVDGIYRCVDCFDKYYLKEEKEEK